jgi:hypothetical protein
MNNEPVSHQYVSVLERIVVRQVAEIEHLKELFGCDPAYYEKSAKTITDEEIIESLAELEHQQWIQWASTIMQTEKISDGRIARWKDCFKPYSELSEEMKEHDRAWARKALAILRKAQEADKVESLGPINIGGVNFRNGKIEK